MHLGKANTHLAMMAKKTAHSIDERAACQAD
jgi:hypothetical protein